jgi:hypothetical protein
MDASNSSPIDQTAAPLAEDATREAASPSGSPTALRPGAPIPPDHPLADEILARNLTETGSALYLYGSAARLFPQLTTGACISYVAGMVEDAGAPSGSLERLLVEQLVQMHHAAGRLLMKAEGAGTAEARSLLVAAAARMFAEYRKSLLALQSVQQASVARPQVAVDDDIARRSVVGESRQVALATCTPEASDRDSGNQTEGHSPRRRSA